MFHLYFSPICKSEYLGFPDGPHLKKKHKYSRGKMLLIPDEEKELASEWKNVLVYENTAFSIRCKY